MIELEEHFQQWRAELTQTGIARGEVLDELENHLRERTGRLIKAGASEIEAFRAAVRELGESRVLKREFAKLNRHWFWGFRDNPVALKILACWLILIGLDGLTYLPHVRWNPMYDAMSSLVRLLPALQIFVGVGLLRRHNFWRFSALAWSLYSLIFSWLYIVGPMLARFYFSVLMPQSFNSAPPADPSFFIFLGLRLPGQLFPPLELLNAVILLWGGYMLTRSSIAGVFSRALAR